MRVLDAGSAARQVGVQLGLPSQGELDDTALFAAALRRSAGFMCPCSPQVLIEAVVEAMHGIGDDGVDLTERTTEVLDGLVGHGDLVEVESVLEAGGDRMLRLHAAPPSFIRRRSGRLFLTGIVPDALLSVPDLLCRDVVCVGFVRYLGQENPDDVIPYLEEIGLIEVPLSRWLRAPAIVSAPQLVKQYTNALAASQMRGDVAGVTILDSARPARHYRARWCVPEGQTGDYVGRRPQAYGADLWCFLRLDNGRVSTFVDLPMEHGPLRGCDVAWRLQAAIDYVSGDRQTFRVSSSGDGMVLLGFDGPIPGWVQRRLDYVGEPARLPGTLLAYAVPDKEAAEESEFLERALWMAPIIADRGE